MIPTRSFAIVLLLFLPCVLRSWDGKAVFPFVAMTTRGFDSANHNKKKGRIAKKRMRLAVKTQTLRNHLYGGIKNLKRTRHETQAKKTSHWLP